MTSTYSLKMNIIRSAITVLAFFGISQFSSCGNEELEVVADYSYELVGGYTYKFSVLTADYTRLEWTIEGQTYTEAVVEHTFSGQDTFSVSLMVELEGEKGDKVSDTRTRTLVVGQQFETIKVTTSLGTFGFYLYQSTPKHKANMIKLAREGYLNGTTFHRVIKNFVIQGGDPLSKDADPDNDGTGGPGYTIPRELNSNLKHVQGAIGAAKKSTETASNGSQFYVVEGVVGAHQLNGLHTVFGIVMYGNDVVTKIASQSVDGNSRPTTDIPMTVDLVWYSAEELKAQFDFEIPLE
ncbi:MAG: peptidylprolyl isomerase [Bacteroidetes bacterium]|jgi:peptidyl-prolyl cis-trans isomerase B (cyclophilin B)|nr:peptidylprolyl isomerase [Bacteroidota bacterium]